MPMNGGKCHNITFSKGYNIFGALNFTGNQTYLNSFKLKSSFFLNGITTERLTGNTVREGCCDVPNAIL